MLSGSLLHTFNDNSAHDSITARVPQQEQSTPSLLTLPQEIRDQIYDQVSQLSDPFEIFVHVRGTHPYFTESIVFVVSYTQQKASAKIKVQSRRPCGIE